MEVLQKFLQQAVVGNPFSSIGGLALIGAAAYHAVTTNKWDEVSSQMAIVGGVLLGVKDGFGFKKEGDK